MERLPLNFKNLHPIEGSLICMPQDFFFFFFLAKIRRGSQENDSPSHPGRPRCRRTLETASPTWTPRGSASWTCRSGPAPTETHVQSQTVRKHSLISGDSFLLIATYFCLAFSALQGRCYDSSLTVYFTCMNRKAELKLSTVSRHQRNTSVGNGERLRTASHALHNNSSRTRLRAVKQDIAQGGTDSAGQTAGKKIERCKSL